MEPPFYYKPNIPLPPKTTEKLVEGRTFEVDETDFVNVYTDGSCFDSGKDTARGGAGVFFGKGNKLNFSKPVQSSRRNATKTPLEAFDTEIEAVILALRIAQEHQILRLCIISDCQLLITSLCFHFNDWRERGNTWKNHEFMDRNEGDLKYLVNLTDRRVVKFAKVKSNKNKADALSRIYSKRNAPKYVEPMRYQENFEEVRKSEVPVLKVTSLNPYLNKWETKARVAKKSEISCDDDGNKNFTFDLADDSGRIRVSVESDIKKFFPLIEDGQSYSISNCRLIIFTYCEFCKNNIQHEYKMITTSRTIIKKCSEI